MIPVPTTSEVRGESGQQLTLDEIVITQDLDRRAPSAKAPQMEVDALHSLAARLLGGRDSMLEALTSAAVRICRAGTAGVSLLERATDGAEVFRWVSVAGRLKDSVGGCTPRNFSPCGTCLDRKAAQLYDRPGRYFSYLEPAGIVEGLVVPFCAGDVPLGTVWIVSHDDSVRFDREDVRVMTSLAGFAAATLQLTAASNESERRLREAQEARKRNDEFLALLGHELRNPLPAIVAALEIIRMRGAHGVEKALDTAKRQVRNMSRLIDGLLDVSRITRGALELRRERVALDTIVARAVEAGRAFAESRGHQLSLSLGRGILVDGDPLRIEQMVVNLVNNAAKFTPRGGRIGVSCTMSADRARVVVSDTGVGLSSEQMERIFEPFVRLEPGSECTTEGLGIGLTLARRLAELHGGTLSVESEGAGRGATFTVELQCTRIGIARGAGDDLESAPLSAALRVLVVDKDAEAAEMLSELLRMQGHEARIAVAGRVALMAAAGFRPDIVLVDLALADIDGYEVARKLRARNGMAEVRIIALSGSSQPGDRERSKAAGFDAHLVKPIELRQLLAMLENHSA